MRALIPKKTSPWIPDRKESDTPFFVVPGGEIDVHNDC